MQKDFKDFNKQIFFGEIGSLIGAPLAGTITSLFTQSASTISGFTVAGSLAGAGLFWLATRIIDEKKKGKFSMKKLAGDIALYSPAAFLIVIFFYQPVLYFLTKAFLSSLFVTLAVIFAQMFAFLLFLVLINLYRIIVNKYFNREL